MEERKSTLYKKDLFSTIKVNRLCHYTTPFFKDLNQILKSKEKFRFNENAVSKTFKGRKNCTFPKKSFDNYKKMLGSFSEKSGYRSCYQSAVAYEKMFKESTKAKIITTRRIIRSLPELLRPDLFKDSFPTIKIEKINEEQFHIYFSNQRNNPVTSQQIGFLFEFFMDGFKFKNSQEFKKKYENNQILMKMAIECKDESEELLEVIYSGEIDSIFLDENGKVSSMELKWKGKSGRKIPAEMEFKWKNQLVSIWENKIGFGFFDINNNFKTKFTQKESEKILKVFKENYPGNYITNIDKKEKNKLKVIIPEGVSKNRVIRLLKEDENLSKRGYSVKKLRNNAFIINRGEKEILRYKIKNYDLGEHLQKVLKFSAFCLKELYKYAKEFFKENNEKEVLFGIKYDNNKKELIIEKVNK